MFSGWDIPRIHRKYLGHLMSGFASRKVLLQSTLGPSFSRLFNRTMNGCFPAGWLNGKSMELNG